MSRFTCGDIDVEGIDHIQTLLRVYIKNSCNTHPEAEFEGIYDKGTIDKLNSMSQSTYIKIQKHEKDGKAESLFVGYIEEVVLVKEELDYDIIKVRLLTKTCFMEHDIKSRSFQDVAMTYAELMSKIVHETPGIIAICNVGQDTVIGMPIIQFQESNWDFLKRLASHFQATLLIDETVDNTVIRIGTSAGSGTVVDGKKVSMGISNKFYELGENEAATDKASFQYIKVKSDNNAAVGGGVMHEGEQYYVCEKELKADGSEFIYTHTLGNNKLLETKKKINDKFIGCAIHGTVLDVKNETLKLKLDLEDDTQNAATAYYYNWTPITGNMMYCMPEKDTQVSLYFGDGEETSGTVIDCVRMNGAKQSAFSNSRDKYLTTDYNKMMKMTEETFEFIAANTSEQKNSLKVLNQDTIAFDSFNKFKVKGKNIVIEGDNITISVPVQAIMAQQKKDSSTGASMVINVDIDGKAEEVLVECTDQKSYCIIDDAPKAVANSEFKKKLIGNFLFGCLITAVVAVAAAAIVVATAGTGAVLVGAVIGATAAGLGSTIAMTYNDAKSGTAQSTWQFGGKVLADSVIGAVSGAVGGGLEKAGVSIGKRLLAEEGFTLLNDSVDKVVDCTAGGQEFDMGDFLCEEVFSMGFSAVTFGLTDKAAKDVLGNTRAGRAVQRGKDAIKNSSVGRTVSHGMDSIKNSIKSSTIYKNAEKFLDGDVRSSSLEKMDEINNRRKTLINSKANLKEAEATLEQVKEAERRAINERSHMPRSQWSERNQQIHDLRQQKHAVTDSINTLQNDITALKNSIHSDLFGTATPPVPLTSMQINLANLKNNVAQLAGEGLAGSPGSAKKNMINTAGQDLTKDRKKAITNTNKENLSEAQLAQYEYVTRGAKLTCDCGSHKRRLNLLLDHALRMDKSDADTVHPFVHEDDKLCGEGQNITPFGVCQGKNPPPSPTVTYHEYRDDGSSSDGLVQGKACTPIIVDGWCDVKKDAFIGDGGAKGKVLTCSYLQCKFGGIITVETSGQEYKGELDKKEK